MTQQEREREKKKEKERGEKRNREREKENLPKLRKKDLDSRANDTLYRLRHNLNYPNLSTIMKWANVLDVDISEFFQPI